MNQLVIDDPALGLRRSSPRSAQFQSLILSIIALTTVALIAAACTLPVGRPARVVAQGGDLVQTEWGPVRGFQAGQTYAFLGVPFAAPPAGNLRWRPPADPQPWTAELSATAFGPPCPQWDDEAGAVIGNEDCLYLNVWTPIAAAPGTDLPVMVFIHGGGNVRGSASQTVNGIHLYDGQELAERGGVVVVTVQYRLGALGFLVHPGLDAESEHGGSGNYGLLDQIKALEWVQNNIRSFGGDPARVLLFGESGGAVDTCMLLTSPLAEGLFSRALMESGGCGAEPAAERSAEGLDFAEAAGCGSEPDPIRCLREQTAPSLVTAVDTTPITGGIVTRTFGPNVDGYVLPQPPLHALALGEHNQVPFVIGANADEMLPWTPLLTQALYERLVHELLDPFGSGLAERALDLYPIGTGPAEYATPRRAYAALLGDGQFVCPSRRIARLAAASQATPAYRYFFSQSLSSLRYVLNGANHGLELLFVFQRLEDIQDYSPTPADLALQEAILGYWTRFAASGDPNGTSAPAWPLYDMATDPYLELGTPLVSGEGVRPNKCDFWDTVVPPSLALRKTASAASVRPGDVLTYTLALANSGGTAAGVVITDTLDSHTIFVAAGDGGLYDSGVVTWNVGDLPASERITRSLVVAVDDVAGDVLLVNTVQVSSSQGITAADTATTLGSASVSKIYLPLTVR